MTKICSDNREKERKKCFWIPRNYQSCERMKEEMKKLRTEKGQNK